MDLYFYLIIVWWLLLGVLLIALGAMVGMDMGVGTILRYVGRTDEERRVALNIIGPHWDGNQVWFVLGGGAIFAAWPLVYATSFSGFYIVMLILLWSMIIRPLGFEYRSQIPSASWRNVWDWSLFISGFIPMLVFGAAVGNVLLGVPFHFSNRMVSYYTGSFIELFNPYAILCGLVAVGMAIYKGGAMLMIRSGEEKITRRARTAAIWGGIIALIIMTILGFWSAGLPGYEIVQSPAPGVQQTPLHQTVAIVPDSLLSNYDAHPVLWLLPALAYAGIILGIIALLAGHPVWGWWLGASSWVGVIGMVGAAMFPFIMPSSSDPSHSLTVWNSGASELTMGWMLGFSAIFIPLIACYTSWAFHVMRGKVDLERLEQKDGHMY
ncbi:MAG TPA: cytochrome d ubiquinol oxidase subunit II [Paenalcaligenes sp.]|nr:cytochrome d ubiquinol oxidase subunit II [Paenalcaligenes sp.]